MPALKKNTKNVSNIDSNSFSDSNNNNSVTSTAVPFKKLKIGNPPRITTIAAATMSTTPKNDAQDEKDEFEIVKVYLLNCPLVRSNSPAIKAAIEGIEKEEKRRIRDAKLRSKFGGNNNTATTSKIPKIDGDDDGDELVVVEKDDVVDNIAQPVLVEAPGSGNNSSSHDNDDMEWQDVQQQQKDEDAMIPSVRAIEDSFMMGESDMTGNGPEAQRPNDDDDSSSFLGQTLATACIEAIARRERKPVVASTPLVAIFIALHASLRSDVLGFACTEIPDESQPGAQSKKALGFAPPIRELRKNEFLPRNWDTVIGQKWPSPLRYRKLDTGAMVLRVEGHPSDDDKDEDPQQMTECRVTFAPANSKDDPTQQPCLRFPISEHFNLESWNAAQAKTTTSRIPPSLHYKNLPGLLSKFCRTFDLGAIQNDSVEDTIDKNKKSSSSNISSPGTRVKKVKVQYSKMKEPSQGGAVFRSEPLSRSAMELRETGFKVPTTVDKAFPPAAATAARRLGPEDPLRMGSRKDYPHHGDFSGDLLPQPPMGVQPLPTGNLMGPNHPMFARGGRGGVGPLGGGIPLGGPGTMQPRFDPVMPPGIGGGEEHHPDRRRRMPGEPNPDHLRPPNSFGSHSMFM